MDNACNEVFEKLVQLTRKFVPEGHLDKVLGSVGRLFSKKTNASKTNASTTNKRSNFSAEFSGVEKYINELPPGKYKKAYKEMLARVKKIHIAHEKDATVLTTELDKILAKISGATSENYVQVILDALIDFFNSPIIKKFMKKGHSNTGKFLGEFYNRFSKTTKNINVTRIDDATSEKISSFIISFFEEWADCSSSIIPRNLKGNGKDSKMKRERTVAFCKKTLKKAGEISNKLKELHSQSNSANKSTQDKSEKGKTSTHQNPKTAAKPESKSKPPIAVSSSAAKAQEKTTKPTLEILAGIKELKTIGIKLLTKAPDWKKGIRGKVLNWINGLKESEEINILNSNITGAKDILVNCYFILPVDENVKIIAKKARDLLSNLCEYLGHTENLTDNIEKNIEEGREKVKEYDRSPFSNSDATPPSSDPQKTPKPRPLPKLPVPKDVKDRRNKCIADLKEIKSELNRETDGNPVWRSRAGQNVLNFIEALKTTEDASKNQYPAAHILENIFINLKDDIQNDVNLYDTVKKIFETVRNLLETLLTELKHTREDIKYITDILSKYKELPPRPIQNNSVLSPEEEKKWQHRISEKAEVRERCREMFKNPDINDKTAPVFKVVRDFIQRLSRRSGITPGKEMLDLSSDIGTIVSICNGSMLYGDNRKYVRAMFDFLKALCDELDIRIQYHKAAYPKSSLDNYYEKSLNEGRETIGKFKLARQQTSSSRPLPHPPASKAMGERKSDETPPPQLPPRPAKSQPSVSAPAAPPAPPAPAAPKTTPTDSKPAVNEDLLKQVREGKKLRKVQGSELPNDDNSRKSHKEGNSINDMLQKGVNNRRRFIEDDDDNDDDYTDIEQDKIVKAPTVSSSAEAASKKAPPAPAAPKTSPRSANSTPSNGRSALNEEIIKGKKLRKVQGSESTNDDNSRKSHKDGNSESNQEHRDWRKSLTNRVGTSNPQNEYINSQDAGETFTQLCKEVQNLNSEGDFEKYSKKIRDFDKSLSRSLTHFSTKDEEEYGRLNEIVGNCVTLEELAREYSETNDENKRAEILVSVDSLDEWS